MSAPRQSLGHRAGQSEELEEGGEVMHRPSLRKKLVKSDSKIQSSVD